MRLSRRSGPLRKSTNPMWGVLRLTLLAPDIVEAILNGRQPVVMTLAVLVRPFSVLWEAQRSAFSCFA